MFYYISHKQSNLNIFIKDNKNTCFLIVILLFIYFFNQESLSLRTIYFQHAYIQTEPCSVFMLLGFEPERVHHRIARNSHCIEVLIRPHSKRVEQGEVCNKNTISENKSLKFEYHGRFEYSRERDLKRRCAWFQAY